MRFMNRNYLNSIAALVKEKPAWDAFLAVLAFEEERITIKLKGPKEPNDLIRINAEYTLIQHMKNIKDNAANAEREFTNR